LVEWGAGGSGSMSMFTNRKASGHDRNDSTRLGDRLFERSSFTRSAYATASTTMAATVAGSTIGPKWSR
jgi:hypothetical protein